LSVLSKSAASARKDFAKPAVRAQQFSCVRVSGEPGVGDEGQSEGAERLGDCGHSLFASVR
jgi:hypothetical protein